MKLIHELNEASFEKEVQQAIQPVVVDFWADWCGPCKMLGSVLEEIASEQQGQAIVAKVNIDEQPALAARFQIQGIPTLLYFNNGVLRGQTVGVVSKKTILAKLADVRAEAGAGQPA